MDALTAAIENLPLRLSSLDNGMDDVRQAVRRVENSSSRVTASTGDLAVTVKRLSARVEWLERNVRLQPETSEAELDAFDRLELELAAKAEFGNLAKAELLSAGSRKELEAAVTTHVEAVRSRSRRRTAAMIACQALADTRYDHATHAQARREFLVAVNGLADARARADELADPADRATDVLQADDEEQVAVSEVVADGERAWTLLQRLLRTRLAESVGEGKLLPDWFTRVLGPIPSPDDTAAWMEVGTSLLAYRATYAVSDPFMALGADPESDQSPRRRAWHLQLSRQFAELER
jgi:hypothetical protein